MAAIQTCFRRYEKKYLLTPAQQEFILHGARGYMKEDAYGRYTICNIYYDTEDYSLIRSSLDKPVYKEKLRVRSYGTPQPQEDVFVEIKKKVDGIVYKRRVKLAAGLAPRYLAGDLALSPGGQISREIEWFQRFHRTQPRVFIGYDRMALARGRRRRAAAPAGADIDGDQDPRRSPAVAGKTAFRGGGVSRVVFQIRPVLPRAYRARAGGRL